MNASLEDLQYEQKVKNILIRHPGEYRHQRYILPLHRSRTYKIIPKSFLKNFYKRLTLKFFGLRIGSFTKSLSNRPYSTVLKQSPNFLTKRAANSRTTMEYNSDSETDLFLPMKMSASSSSCFGKSFRHGNQVSLYT